MLTPLLSTRARDGKLWVVAFCLSLVINLFSLCFISIHLKKTALKEKRPAIPVEQVLTILQNRAAIQTNPPASAAAPEVAANNKNRFAHTSEDQKEAKPDGPAFTGERNTQATSSSVPTQSAEPLPSQSGVKPRNSSDIETIDSRYQDGELPKSAADPSAPSKAEPLTTPSLPVAAAEAEQNPAKASPTPPPSTKSNPRLVEGSSVVDVPVQKTLEAPDSSTTPTSPVADPVVATTQPNPATAKPSTPNTSLPKKSQKFKGNQRKTAIIGSISRTGRSALNVVDSPLGRYQANVSRAVEQEWQRNCIRHRDFITPGFLTVRFYLETSGRVRTVQFVGQMETGEVQKGFTLNAIRDADIPSMPPELKKEFEQEPLEIIFNFYF